MKYDEGVDNIALQRRINIMKDRFGHLIQSKIENERINDTTYSIYGIPYKYIFSVLIAADPTPSKKHVKWLIESYINNDIKAWSDIDSGPGSRAYFILTKFESLKNQLPVQNRKSSFYNGLDDMESTLDSIIQYDESNDNELKHILTECVMIYNGRCKVIAPLTYKAALWFSEGTEWKLNEQYSSMIKVNPIYVILLHSGDFEHGDIVQKSDRLLLWNNNGSISLINRNGEIINPTTVRFKWKMLEPVLIYTGSLKYIPLIERTPELCMKTIKYNGHALRHVPKVILTYDMCLEAIKQNGLALKFIPEFIWNELDDNEKFTLCKIAVEQNGMALEWCPSNISSKLHMEAVKSNGYALSLIPKEQRTPEHVYHAIKQNGLVIQYLDENIISYDMWKTAIKQNGRALAYAPLHNHTLSHNQIWELCELAVKQNGRALRYVPFHIDTPEDIYYNICKTACQQDGTSLERVPHKFKTYELCSLAVEQNPDAMTFVPDEIKGSIVMKNKKHIPYNDDKIQQLKKIMNTTI